MPSRVKPYILAGAGVYSYTRFHNGRIEDGSSSDGDAVSFGDDAMRNRICFGLLGGAGMNFRIGRFFSFYAQYKLRYWKPIEYVDEDRTEIYDMTTEYAEIHFGNIMEIGILFKAR
jgi:hypothetical protein